MCKNPITVQMYFHLAVASDIGHPNYTRCVGSVGEVTSPFSFPPGNTCHYLRWQMTCQQTLNLTGELSMILGFWASQALSVSSPNTQNVNIYLAGLLAGTHKVTFAKLLLQGLAHTRPSTYGILLSSPPQIPQITGLPVKECRNGYSWCLLNVYFVSDSVPSV